MADDRGDQDLVEEGTTYRYGPETSRKGLSEGLAGELRSAAENALESALNKSPADDLSAHDPFQPSFANSTIDLGSDTAGLAGTAGPLSSGLRMTLLDSPQPGDTLFKKYRVEKLLGKGGMGEVWLVRHKILRAQFALKLIFPGAVIDQEAVRRFVLEAQVMQALSQHRHAVVVHDADIDVERRVIYIVMDVVHGKSIEKLLKRGVPMPLDWTTEVLGQLCDVLHHAHELGIVHRDLSPGNLMLEDSPDGSVHLRVLDFGVAKVLDPKSGVFAVVPLTENGRFFGKRAYASPEQLGGDGVGPRSDIYSIGVMLYEFLTGYRPFQGNPQQLMLDHCMVDPPPFAEINPAVDLPRAVEQVVRCCMAKAPDDRPQSAPELFDLFQAAVLETKPSGRVWLKRWRLWLSRAALILGCTVLVGLVLAILVPRLFRFWPRTIPARILPVVSREISDFLTSRQLLLIPGSGVGAGGCPKEVERIADGRRYAWHDGIYLPKDYQPDLSEGKAGRLPRVLVRTDGPRFLLIEGGEFVMGAFGESDKDFDRHERPGHRVVLSSFYMQETEVTFGEFDRFCEEMRLDRNAPELGAFSEGRSNLGNRMPEEELRHYPAVGVTRKLAEAYARRVGGELPSEAQWEFAARSRGNNQFYVWGNDPPFKIKKKVNINQIPFGRIDIWPVDLPTDDRTEQGVLSLAGNVREWCRDEWKFYGERESKDPVQIPAGDNPNPLFVIRGASYDTPYETARTTWRRDREKKDYRAKNDHSDFDLGFRIVVEIIEVPDSQIARLTSEPGPAGGVPNVLGSKRDDNK
jgi:serine/threonine-protein kinase